MKELYPFQQANVDKLYKQRSRLVGDEMGLGKTLTGIELDKINRRDVENGRYKKTLIVAPLTVLPVWEEHLKEQTDLPVTVIDNKSRQGFINAALKPERFGYFVCHWDALRLMPELTKVKWFHIIADEAHRAKNRKAQQTRALKRLPTTFKTGLSGTPGDDKPQDLWSVINWLWPKYYTSYWRFFKHYVVSEFDERRGYHKVTGVKNVEGLHEEMAPWFARHLKAEVLKDLPPRYYSRIPVTLGQKQRRAYDQMQKEMIAWVEGKTDAELETPLIASQVVAQLTRLQQFALGYMEFNPELKGGQGGWQISEPSAKLDVVMDILADNEGEPIVVFSQFKSVLNILARRLEKKGISYGMVTGDIKKGDRALAVEQFQAGELQVFMGTIAAAGEGITLTRASTVVFLDRAWRHSQNRQAEDRLHRIGQQEAVQVIDLVAQNTVDLGRLQKIERKASWVRQIIGDPEPLQRSFSREAA